MEDQAVMDLFENPNLFARLVSDSVAQNNLRTDNAKDFHQQFQHLALHDQTALYSLLSMEMQFTIEIHNLLSLRDSEKTVLQQTCSAKNDDEISSAIEAIEENYNSQLDALRSVQVRQFRKLVDALYERHCNTDLFFSSRKAESLDMSFPESLLQSTNVHMHTVLDEGFTIFLGNQLKTMHNLRLLNFNPVYSQVALKSIDDVSTKLQSALFLYGNHLHGLIQLVKEDADYHSLRKTDLFKACERSPELHFSNLISQLEKIKTLLKTILRSKRVEKAADDNHGTQLTVGDVYITRHSNLGAAQIIFHLVSDESLSQMDLTSRHACMDGLRNIIRVCHEFGITTISVPLLLVTEISPELHNESWCLRRAEMVFKSVKGFMIEFAKYASTPQYTIQFYLPENIDISVFHHCSDMIPAIFQTTGPLFADRKK
ncbi:Uncharacterized protein T4B_10203 [Trichinella pseudospiralis]|uniref:Uncharacterized protein n=1 Tax=Trichinella pseudospiralis TaxID=6337 RepID=A0A0V1IER8_TRIPS|nr:Uncharacterized protein T4B_10203 [Trichinella pseudospiralis]KRZ35291.1 Uncharacterized protein T4C_9595 [Trichinella pseudospiralis]